MPLRVPPGRAGRPWLAHRIDVARRGAEVLDQKHQALLREQLRLRGLLAETESEWDACARVAGTWLRRAALLAGERRLRLARFYARGSAHIELTWRNSLGVVYPADAQLTLPDAPDFAALGGSSALVDAAAAHRLALEAAARLGAARMAYERVTAELERAARRLRAIEHRWLPEHERALAALELGLDEGEREDAARIRWVRRNLAGRRP